MAFYRNLASLRRKRILLEPEKTQNYPGLILNKIVVFEFFIRRHKTYNSLVK
jgi:hypothetical protein